ncbi:MAG: DUF485 domain-containing protein [Gammaproteobacteria bacterium]|nr:DUF485 domain-containing protein [Gammaproteobacteria bacterium]MCY4211535.1 DUF485 domain-containing protein [Gammaproteobacteria bacterium]MCY4283683.1 DUF485 domain-containing protein [Gammaproteobacteria bacterium]MCY4339142.1 DUF485 domain-containing protein [Gammaproteobacteria bacterium]
METPEQIHKLSTSADYRALVRRRRGVTLLLTLVGILQFVVYFGAIAWLPAWSGGGWPQGSAVSVIIWLTVLVIVLSVLMSAFYIWWTGRYFDPERERIVSLLDAQFEGKPEVSAAKERPEDSAAAAGSQDRRDGE